MFMVFVTAGFVSNAQSNLLNAKTADQIGIKSRSTDNFG